MNPPADQPPNAPAAGFEAFLQLLDQPVYVVTTAAGGEGDDQDNQDDRDDGNRAGCLVGFGSPCSLRPARFAVWLSHANRTYRMACRSTVLAVHLLPADDAGAALARLFGGETGDEVDKFARAGWRPGPAGVPVLTEAVAWFAGRVVGRVEGGDHTGFLLSPLDGAQAGGAAALPPAARRDVTALTLRDVDGIDPGHPA